MPAKNDVPALERGLDILEAIAEKGSMNYKAVVDELSLPSASAARILKSLCRRGYLAKSPESGAYSIGHATERIVPKSSLSAHLKRVGLPVLARLRDTIDQTAVLFHWTGIAWECIAKESHEDALTMQTVGETRVDIFNYPWGVFAYEQVSGENRRLMLNVDKASLQKSLADFNTNGYAVSRGKVFSRLAVPIKRADGELVGALAVGVMQMAMQELTERAVADLLIASGKLIEDRLHDL